MKETLQFIILTGLMAYDDEKDGLCINFFYKKTREEIKNHWEYANEVYPKVFRQFIGVSVARYYGGYEIASIIPQKQIEKDMREGKMLLPSCECKELRI